MDPLPTVGEFMWFSQFSNEPWFFPKQDALDRALVSLNDLLKKITERQNTSW